MTRTREENASLDELSAAKEFLAKAMSTSVNDPQANEFLANAGKRVGLARKRLIELGLNNEG